MSSAVEILIKTAYQGQGASAAKVDLSSIKTLGKSVSDSLKNVGSTLTGIGGKLTASVTLPILGIGGASLKLASDFEQTQVAFTTMLGDADKAKTLFNELRDFSASTPFEFPEIRDAGRSLLAFGVSAEDVTASLRRIGDISAGVGAPVGEIAELYGKAKVQGRLFAEDINQFQGRGIPILQELATVLGVSTAEVKNLVEKGKVGFPELEQAFQNMTNNGGQFAGMMEAQSQTLGGLFSTLKDTVTLTLADLGTQIIETFDLKAKLTGVIEFLSGLSDKIRSFAQSNPELFKLAISFAAVAAAIGPVLVGVGWLATAIGSAMPVIAGIGAALGALFSPIGLVVAGVGLLAAAIYNDWGGIGTFAAEVWTNVTTAASNAVSGFGNAMSEISNIGRDTVDAIQWIWEGKGDNIDWWSDITDGLVSMGVIGQETGDKLSESLFNIGTYASSVISGLRTLASGQDIATLQTNVTTALSNIGASIKSYFSGDISLGGLASAVSQGFLDITSAISTFFGGADFGTFLSDIKWSDFIEKLSWENVIGTATLVWSDYISPLLWSGWLTVVSWADWLTSLDWTKIITTTIDWATWIPALSWAGIVTAIEWGLYIGSIVWSGFISTLNWLDATGEKLDWSSFVSALTWASYIVSFTWDSFIDKLEWTGTIATLTSWGDYIKEINWGNFVIMLLDWATWIPALTWNSFVAAIDWTVWLASLDWSTYIDTSFSWSSYIVSVAWSDWIPAAFSWSSYVFSLTWSSFVSKLNWPSISWPGFSTFVPHLSWPSISWPGWGSFIPAFPGWPNISGMISDAIGSATSYVTGNNAVGTSYWGGGLTWVGERGPELVNLPSGARVHNAVDSRRMADGGAVGGASITNHIYVQNDIDVEALLFKLEDMQRRRR
jgi:tape measure domain-containing protein